jgi:hypothetical protein
VGQAAVGGGVSEGTSGAEEGGLGMVGYRHLGGSAPVAFRFGVAS